MNCLYEMNSFSLTWWESRVWFTEGGPSGGGDQDGQNSSSGWEVAGASEYPPFHRPVSEVFLFPTHPSPLLSHPSLPSSFPSSICSHGMTGEHMVIINPLSSPMVKTTQKRTIYTTFIYSAEALSNCSSGKNLTHCFSEEDGHWLQHRGMLKSMFCWKLDVDIN